MSSGQRQLGEEGWFKDPYELHQDRWFSDGTPTQLVRDGAVESTDPPPGQPPRRPLISSDEDSGASGPEDTLRAGGASRMPTSADFAQAGEVFWIAHPKR